MTDFGELLRRYRTATGLTQEQLAERSELSVGAIATLERGRRRYPRPTTIAQLADALDLSESAREALVEAGRRSPRTLTPDELPADLDDFVGRDRVVAELFDALRRPSTAGMAPIAISGMGGIGKTALAVRVAGLVADAYPDGRLYLNLCGHSDRTALSPLEALGQLLQGLGTPGRDIPVDVGVASSRFRSLIAGKRMLILLDDAAGRAQVEPLLPGSGGSVAVITSRPTLVGLAGARHTALDLLSEGEAVSMLSSILGRRAAQEPEAALEIARLCGTLPLALRIAGGHLIKRPDQSLAELATALADERTRVEVLSKDDTGARAMVGLSVRALAAGTPPVQQAAARAYPLVALIEGDEFSLRIARAALDLPEDEAEAALEYLVDVSLLETPAFHVYRLHDLLRSVGRELTAPATAEGVRLRVLNEYLALLWRGDELASAPRVLSAGWRDPLWSRSAHDLDRGQAYDIVDTEREGLLRTVRSAARGSADARRQVIRLAPAIGAFAKNRKRWIEWRDLNLVAIELIDERSDPLVAAMTTFDLGLAHNELEDHSLGAAMLLVALQLARKIGDREFEGRCLFNLAHARERQGQLAAAHELTLQYLELAVREQDQLAQSWAHMMLGIIAGREGRQDEQQEAFERSFGLFAELDVPKHLFGTQHQIVGESYLQAGRFELASVDLLEALDVYRAENRQGFVAEILDHLGAVQQGLGHWDEALDYQEQALALALEYGLWDREASIRLRRVRTWQAVGRLAEAREDAVIALRLYEAHGSPTADEVRGLLDELPPE